MFDPSTIGAALTSAKAILDLLRNANDAQFALKISTEVVHLQSQLLTVQQQALALQNENQNLRDEIRQVKRAREEENSFQFLHGVYWKTSLFAPSDEDEDEEDEHGHPIGRTHWEGPFCPLCKDVDGKAVRLKSTGQKHGSELIWECEVHNTDYEAPTMQPRR
jgi:hypothetical protein